ncbi:FAD/NAD(P)-binding oxidoreductase [Bordetella sputigena]|uniref:FAD-dependent oxidoreductase n=1 Tax=Bordetella sputigena TaxID=1416810 RepID=UPI0039EFD66A
MNVPADAMAADGPVVIVGAGPAGVRAGQTLLRHGVRPVVLDEGARAGGQIYRRPPAGRDTAPRQRYGFEWRRATAIHDAGDALARQADYHAESLVWNAGPGLLHVLESGQPRIQRYARLLLATGATDRVLPFPGWTLPGVYTLGGAQVALKSQDCVLGPRIVFAGTGPLLYLVAYQYARAGARVAAVVDTSPWTSQASALPGLAARPAVLAKGLYYAAWLHARGVPIHRGARLREAHGRDTLHGLRFSVGGKTRELACDALAVGFGLRSETQLADLLDCAFDFDPLNRAWLPRRDGAGRASVPGVYLAGDGAGIAGADHAEWAGERAALALLEDMGMAVDGARARTLERRLSRSRRFRRALEQAFPLPDAADLLRDGDTTLCRCEEITVAEAAAAIGAHGIRDINRLKALSRVGMGMCQGRMCQAGAAEMLGRACGGVELAGRLRAQAPVKPLALSELGGDAP